MMIELFFLLPGLLAEAATPTTANEAPPACLLTVLGKQSSPCQITEICTNDQKSVVDEIEAVCLPSRINTAKEAFFSACSARGIDVTAAPNGTHGVSDGHTQGPRPEVMLYAILGAWLVSTLISICIS